MLITSIFGKYLRDMHSYVGWLESEEGKELRRIIKEEIITSHSICYANLIRQSHTILDQPMKEECLEMFKEVFEISDSYYGSTIKKKEIVHKMSGIHICNYSESLTLNAFATHCQSKNIPLELKETFEIQENGIFKNTTI